MKKEDQEKIEIVLGVHNNNKVKLGLLKIELENLDKMVNANMAMRYDGEYTPKERRQNSVVEYELISIEEKRNQIQREIIGLERDTTKVEFILANIPEQLRVILQTKYIDKKTWAAVEVQLPYNDTYIRKELKNQAMEPAYEYLFMTGV